MIEPGRTLVRKRTESPPEGRRCPHRRQTRAMQFSAGSKPKSIIDIYRIVAITSIAGAAVHGLSMIDGTVHSLYDGRLRTGGRSPRAGTPSILWATDRTVRLRHGRRARPPRTTARPRRALRRSALATGAAAFPSCCRRRHARLPAGACSSCSCCWVQLVRASCFSTARRDPSWRQLPCAQRLPMQPAASHRPMPRWLAPVLATWGPRGQPMMERPLCPSPGCVLSLYI